MDNKKVGELIASLRKKKGLTQEQLGELVGVGYGAVSKWERGINTPDKGIINHVSEILGISSTELLNGEIKEEEINEVEPVITESKEDIINVKEEINEPKEEIVKDTVKKPNKIKYLIISLISIIILIISILLIYNNNNNKTYAYNLLSTSDEYYVEGKVIFRGDELSIVVNKIKFNNNEFNSVVIKNYEYDIYSKDVKLLKRGYIYLTNQLEDKQEIWEFSSNFVINYNNKISVKRQYIVKNNMIIKIKFLDVDNNEIVKDIIVSLHDIKEYVE